MALKLQHLVVPAALLAAALALSSSARAADPPISLDTAYQQIKGAEGKIAVPTPEETVDVGYFNAATGDFDGLTTEIEMINGKPVRMVPHAWVNAVNTRLLFHVYNATKSVRVSVTGGGSATVQAGGTTLAVHAGRGHDLRWTITSGLKRYGDELIVDRPRIIGAGAFTIPALPVAVVYDPPQNPAGTNTDVYTRSTSIGVSLGMNFGSSSSTSTSADPPQFADLTMFHQQLQGAAAFETLVGQSTAATALTDIDKYLGSATRNVATKNDNSGSSKRSYTFTDQRGCAIDAGVQHFGPGRSDMIAYLRNARMVWLDNGSTTYLQLLGYGQFECATIDQLRGGLTQLNPATVTALVALDPFATSPLGPKAQLALDPRFSSLPGIGLLPGIVQTATFTQQLLLDHTSGSAYTRTVTDDLGAGLLSLVGLAPSQSQQIVTTLSVGTTLETTDTTTTSVALTARTLTDGIRTDLALFYDSVFGTVAFQDPRP
jgi:hypothetical protein